MNATPIGPADPHQGPPDAALAETPRAVTREAVFAAADRLIAAFAATDTDGYFACFSPEANFVLHSEPERLDNRAAYERLWSSWLEDGWRVESCASTERAVVLSGEAAVFSHSVHTVTSLAGVTTATQERESVVFARDDRGDLLAIHEHLSAVSLPPAATPDTGVEL